MSVNYYELLGVGSNASSEEIELAYRRLMKRNHPDKHGDQDDPLCRLLNEAYRTLSDPERRKRYEDSLQDSTRRGQRARTTQASPAQLAEERLIPCPTCKGAGSEGFWIFRERCYRCNCTGKVATFVAPSGRHLCHVCGGKGVETVGQGWFAYYSTCGVCQGTGLQPLPKVTDFPCPRCRGYGFALPDIPRNGDNRNRCTLCNGTGVDPDAPKEVCQRYGLVKEPCYDCGGCGYWRTIGPRSTCTVCEGRGWVPGKKFVR